MSASHAHPGSRPVADAPVHALLERIDDLAKRWAISLIAALPLQRIGDLPLDDLAREAPDICAHAIRALASDLDLARLTGAARLGLLAGARDSPSAVRAVDALRVVLWDALTRELPDPHPRQIADLADRLAHVCATIAANVLSAHAPASAEPPPSAQPPGSAHAPASHLRDPPSHTGPARRPPDQHPGEQDPRDPPPAAVPSRPRVLVLDDLSELELSADWPEPEHEPPSPIEVRDLRDHEGPLAWVRSIGRRLQRHARDRRPFAVLLVDVTEIADGRAPRAQPLERSHALTRMERALTDELAVAGTFAREAPGRYWIVTHRGDISFAAALADRLARAVKLSAREQGRFDATVGIAICPDDGREAAALAAHADVEVFAARSHRSADSDPHAPGPPQRGPTAPRGRAAPHGGSAA